jgi:superfamily II DNA/RNA helicase
MLALLFSATFRPKVEALARQVTTDPVRITIGNVGQVSWCHVAVLKTWHNIQI